MCQNFVARLKEWFYFILFYFGPEIKVLNSVSVEALEQNIRYRYVLVYHFGIDVI